MWVGITRQVGSRVSERSCHTFVIPAYGESPFLDECVSSVIAQDVPVEVIISTSTPNDVITSVAEKFGVKLIVNDNRQGIARDWTAAYEVATTRYVTLAHQDDIYDPKYSRLVVEAAQRNTNSSIVFCDYVERLTYIGGESKVRETNSILKVKRLILRVCYLRSVAIHQRWRKLLLLRFGSPISCPTVLFNKELCGSFRFDPSFKVNVDWDAWLRLAKMKGAFVFVRSRAVQHRIYADSATSRGLRSKDRQLEDKRIFESLWPRYVAAVLSALYRLSYGSNSLSDQS